MPTNIPGDFVSICAKLQGFKGSVQGMMKNLDSGTREVVSALLKDWDKNFVEMQKAYPAAKENVDAGIARHRSQMDGLKAKVEAAKQKVAQAQKAAAAKKKEAGKVPAVKPLAPIDPKLGVSLRDELLERFGMKADLPPTNPQQQPGEIWEGWDFGPWERN